MKTSGTKPGRICWKSRLGALALACGLPMLALGATYTTTWKSGGSTGWWVAGDGDGNRWYRFDDGWDIRREDLATGQWSSSGTKNPNVVVFANGDQATMTVNALGGTEHQIAGIWFSNSTSRTFAPDGGAYLKLMGDGTPKIEAASGSGTGSYTFTVPLLLDKTTELNPVGGNLTFNGNITNNSYWINVYGANDKTLSIGGVLSGSGGIAVKQTNSTVVLTNANTFSGGTWVEKGKLQLNTQSNAMGTGTANVGTNATLDLAYGSATLQPVALNLWNGQVTKSTASDTTWRGALTTYNSSTVSVTAGNLYIYGGIAISSGTLMFTNANAGGMGAGGTMTGSGNLSKYGAGTFRLYPGTHSGNITLGQGDMWQYTGAMTGSGTLTMEGGTRYSPESSTERTMTKALVINGNVGLAVNSSGGLVITNTVSLGSGMRIVTNTNPLTISGVISSGGLTKAGAGTMTLSAANTYASGTLISAGVLQIGNNGTSGSVTGGITNNAALAFYRTDAHTNAGALTGTGVLTNRAGVLTLTGTSTMSGNTVVTGGTLIQNGTNVASAVTVPSGSFLYGTGSNGAVTVAGQISAGSASNTVGNLKATALNLENNGRMQVNISAMTGTAGTHWDVITLGSGGGTYTVNAADGSDFVIALKGSPATFDQSLSYVLTIVDAGTASGFAANKFTVDTSEFTPSGGFGSSTFTVDATGGDLRLIVTPAAPPTPADLAASDGTSTAYVALSWTDGARETGYVIWRWTADAPASALAIYTNAANATTYNDTSADPGQIYFYWVSATNTGGTSAKSTANSGYKRLAAPANVAATDGSSTANITVTWDAATGATAYHLFRDTDSDPAGASALGAQSSGYADTPTAGQLYYYWVMASNSTSGGTSDWSTANSGYRKLAAVADVAATENLSDKVTVTWTDGTGETGYSIWRHTADVSGSAGIVGTAAANATSYDDATAVAGTPYYYWVRATNSTSASMSDFSVSDLGQKTLAEPTAAASNIVFSSIGSSSLTVGWERGNGDNVLVVAKQGGAPTDPGDTSSYDADANFGDGDETAAGSYVVYKGSGTSVPVTGLTPETAYYFAVYEFNGTGGQENYRTSDEPVSNKTTLATEPSTQASSIAISSPAEVSMSGFTWTDGNGSSRILVMKAGNAVDSFPVDATSYSYSTNFGAGGTDIGGGNYVVWSGSGQPARISNLSRDVVYHFRLFEFSGSGVTLNYNTNSAAGNPISQTTMAVNPGGNPTDLAISAIGTNVFTVTWTKGTTGTNTLIVIRAGGNPVDPTDMTSYAADPVFGGGANLGSSSYVVYNGTGSSVTVTNLTPGASYTIEASSFNGSSGSENYRASPTSTSASTLMPEPTQATSILFGTLADTSYAVSFTAGNGLSRLVVAKAGGAVTFLPADATAYTGENNNLGSGTDLGGGNILVHRGTSPFTLSGLSAQTEYHLRIFEYQGTNTTLNYNTNSASGNPANRYTLSVEPSAHAGSLAATTLSDTQIKLDWGAATGESGFIILRKVGSEPTGTPADGTEYSQGNAIGDGTVVYVITAAGAGSVTDSYSTAASTTYFYEIIPYKYDGTAGHATYNYRTAATIPSAFATTGPAEPATSSTLVSFIPASSTSATITWTNTGSAEGTIILVKSNAAVSTNPSDWTNYTASATFASGQEIVAGNYVVFTNAVKFGSVEVSNLAAGSTYHVAVYPYNGSGTLLNYRTTSPATGSLTMLPAPTAQSATADGKTLIDLAWTKNALYDVMIVYKAGSAPTEPTQGTGYNAGDAAGGGTVIYKGGGAALEHVVASGTTHYYAFYSYSGNYYSAGVTASTTTTAFAAGEIVETFSYTNSTALTGRNGETGWGGGWYGDTTLFTNSSGSFANQTNYPNMSGNKLWVSPANDANVAVFRPLGQSFSSGRLYFGYVLNYQYEGPDKYEGLSLFWTNTNEKLFIGEIGNQDQQLGIDSTGSAYTLTKGAGNDYIIVGYYDWGAAEAKAKAFKIGTAAVPTEEPSSWDVTVSKASNTVGTVNTIRLAAGEFGAGSGTPGNTYFDEVRIATNWAGLIGVTPTKPDDPSGQTATADGSEMVRLAWAKNGSGNDVMILHKTTAISTDPTDGVGYGAGSTLDGATVVYKGSATTLEHVVSPGTTNFYKFYSYTGSDYYSTGVGASTTNMAYADYERVNPFSYTNNTAFGTTLKGGQGFGANYWVANSGTWKAQTNYTTAAADTPKFMDMSNYPAMQGNLAWVENPGDGGSATADRDIETTINSGTFYVAFMMSYQYRGPSKWAGLSLMNGATEKAFFGKGSGSNTNTLAAVGNGTTYWSAFDLLPFGGSGDTGNVYMVVGKYDFSTQNLQTKAWKVIGNTFPETEPGSWDASGTLGTGIDQITRIRLNVGSSDGGATIGRVFFDEIRYATNWAGLIAVRCPTWAGSNTLNNAAWTAASNVWLGDTENFQFQSYPIGPGQSATVDFDWAKNGAYSSSNAMTFWQNANNNSYWTNQVQLTVAGVVTSRFTATAGSCSPARTNNPALTVQNLNPPTGASATRDGVNTNSQINLEWTRGVSGGEKDVLIVRQTADAGWTTPVNGATYNAGDALGSGTVVYRSFGTSFNDSGLAPDTTYYYRFYSENWSYYSVAYDEASASTAPGGQTITIDGSGADWVGSPSTVINSSVSSVQQFIWTDKKGEVRPEKPEHPNGDISEFRVFADDTWVYFLVKMTNITDATKPFVAIGVDTRTNSASTGLNWLGDNAGTDTIGGGYFAGDNEHYPEYQINAHHVSAASGARLEMFSVNQSFWYAPPTGGNTNVVISEANDAIELKVARADLGLTGTTVGRFTVAAFLNTGAWNNDGDGTMQINTDGSIDAVDSISIPPWTVTDNSLTRSAWEEDISDGDIDFWFDVKFGPAGLADNQRPSTPVLVSPTNTANTIANPTLTWQASTDNDGKITGYLLEVSTNDQFNGVTGTENGTIELRVNLDANATNYTLSTSAEYYWWRVRARDTAGELSVATTRQFRVVGKLDAEGPQPTLVYIGTNVAGYLAGDYDERIERYGYIQDVLDSEIQDTNNVFGFVLRWDDASGVYATNVNRSTGGFAYNIVSTDGRVSPNWDLIEIDTVSGTTNDLWGVDKPFYASNTLATGNSDVTMTNYVAAAFSVTNYDPAIEYYLTVSAEDTYTEGGSWWSYGSWPSFIDSSAAEPYYSGWCADGPNTVRNITTNFLIRIHVTDDDMRAPVATTNLGLANNGTNVSLVVSNATDRLDYVQGEGQDVLYEVTDGGLVGSTLWFNFNAYDAYYKGVAIGTSETFNDKGRTLTNSFFMVDGWQTNWTAFNAAASQTNDTTDADTLLTWIFSSLDTNDITALWGAADPADPVGFTNLVQLNMFDVDNDRDDDQSVDLVTFGRLRIVDDDSTDPVVTDLVISGTGLASEYVVTNLVIWDFPGTGGEGSDRLISTNMAAGVTSSPVTLGPSGTISGTDVITVSAGFATGANRYWQFTLMSDPTTKTFRVTSIGFDSRVSSANGPDAWEVWGSTNNFGTSNLWASGTIDMSDPDVSTYGTNWNSYASALTMASATTNALFRLHAYVADTNHLTGTGTATWSVDNLILSGYIQGAAGGTYVTDHDLAHGTARFQAGLYDEHSGLYATVGEGGKAPRVDFTNAVVATVTNAFFTNGLSGNGAAMAALTNIWGYAPAAARSNILAGATTPSNFTAVFTVDDYDIDRTGDSRNAVAISNNVPVYDDDKNAPVRGYKFGGPLGVYVDAAPTKAVSSGNTREYRINDEQLQSAAATSITVKVNLYDYSGWTVPVLSFSNATAGLISTNSWLTALHTAANTTNLPDAEMEWTFAKSQATTMFNSYESITNQFTIVSASDKDDDRQDAAGNNIDSQALTNSRLGYVTFIDNDVGVPKVQSSWSVARTNWNIPKVYLGLPGDSGHSNLLINGATVLADTNSPAALASLTNRVYDSQLARVSAAAPLSVVLPLYDTGGGGQGRTIKGVQRGTSFTQVSVNGGYDITNTYLTIGTAHPSDTGNYRSEMSSPLPLTRIAAQFPTSTWAFTSFSYDQVGDWLAAEEAASNHVMSATVFDADDNRPGDQRSQTDIALGTLQVLDNDTVAPSTPTNVKVNGVEYTGALDRQTAAWTNNPDFRVSFKPAADGEPAGTDLEKTGVGEHRTATAKSGVGPDLGTPLAVPAEGALANYGFENGATNWTLSGAEVTDEQVYEGAHSLKMTGSSAEQTVLLFNTNEYVPEITVQGAQYRGTGTGTLTVTGLDANGDPVGGASYDLEITGSAGTWVMGSSNATELATTVDQVRVALSSGANTYWDDIQVKIRLLDGGNPLDEVNALFIATEQGLTTNYLFAVDRDNNRPGDRKASSAPADDYIPAFGIAYDITPPTFVDLPENAASTENVDDPTTQFDIEWDTGEVGPDKLDDSRHPDYPSAANRDLLSPWRSYKIYYGTFDPLNVPEDDPGHGNGDAYIYTNFIMNGTYTNWLSVSSSNTIADPSGAGTNYLALTNVSQGGIRLYDLDFDQDYAVVVVGVDKAGNEGPASPASWATNNTIKFAVTQGVLKARAVVTNAFGTNHNMRVGDKGAAALYWIAAGQTTNSQTVTKDYDLIYRDASSFQENTNWTWSKVGTIRTNWFTDAPGQDKGLNGNRGDMRFYRASYKDRWRRTNIVSGLPQRPLASEDVYALHNVIVSEGYNYVGLHGQPYTNTFLGVFGADTNLWPAGESVSAGATKIEFFAPGTNAQASEVYFFGIDGNWYQANNPVPITTNLLTNTFFTRAFSITLPTNLAARGYATTNSWDLDNGIQVAAMVWHPILKVPTNGPANDGSFQQVISTGWRDDRGRSTNVYNLVALNLPVSTHPSNMNLIASGFAKSTGTTPTTGDEIYTLNTATKTIVSGSRIYCDATGKWRYGTSNLEVTGPFFAPNDILVIVSKNGGLGNSWTWTYHPTNFYNLPTRWMGQ